jgi:uncharacterized protein YcaQ
MTLRTARRLAIRKQHLDGSPRRRPDAESIMQLMRDMRYLQLDPTSVVAPSHLLVLWSRLGQFRTSDLDRLMWKERKLFEYWAHVASIVLTEDYPLYLARMKKFYGGERTWDVRVREWRKKNAALQKYIIDELCRRGPLLSRDFEDRSTDEWKQSRKKWGLRASAWSSESDISRMLQFLFHDGSIMVAGREGRQKVYDLPERVLPRWTPKDHLSDDEIEYEGAQLSLKALGVASAKQITFHFLRWRYPNFRSTLERLASDSKVLPVKLGDIPESKAQWYIHPDDLQLAEDIEAGEWEPRTTLLSPFDNLITDRDRTLQLFDFFYRIEIYTPKAKRKHGFFVLLILDGDKLIGRIDPSMDRRKERLVVNAVYAEPGAPRDKATALRVAGAVEDLAGFLGAKSVEYRNVPEIWKAALR